MVSVERQENCLGLLAGVAELFYELIGAVSHDHHKALEGSAQGQGKETPETERIRQALIRKLVLLANTAKVETLGRGRTFVSNLNTFSALVDRLAIEHIKLYHLERDTWSNGAGQAESREAVRRICNLLVRHLRNGLRSVIIKGRYSYVAEERTYDRVVDDNLTVRRVEEGIVDAVGELVRCCINISIHDHAKISLARQYLENGDRESCDVMAKSVLAVRENLERRAQLKNQLDSLLGALIRKGPSRI